MDEQIWMPVILTRRNNVSIWGKGPVTPITPSASENRKKKVWGIAQYNIKLQLRVKRHKSRRRNGRLLKDS